MKKNCFVKEKGKKESIRIMRYQWRQKRNGIKEGAVGRECVYAVVFLQRYPKSIRRITSLSHGALFLQNRTWPINYFQLWNPAADAEA